MFDSNCIRCRGAPGILFITGGAPERKKTPGWFMKIRYEFVRKDRPIINAINGKKIRHREKKLKIFFDVFNKKEGCLGGQSSDVRRNIKYHIAPTSPPLPVSSAQSLTISAVNLKYIYLCADSRPLFEETLNTISLQHRHHYPCLPPKA
jgi:hypothetical protein